MIKLRDLLNEISVVKPSFCFGITDSGRRIDFEINPSGDLFAQNEKLVRLVVNDPQVVTILCYTNLLSELHLSNLPNLKFINCNNNNLSKLELKNLPMLSSIDCVGNYLKEIDLRGFSQLVMVGRDKGVKIIRDPLTEIVINKPVPKFKTTKELLDYIKSHPDYKNKIIDEIIENSFLKNGTWDEAIEVWRAQNDFTLRSWGTRFPNDIHVELNDGEDNLLYLSMHNVFNTDRNINKPIKLNNNEIYYTII